VGDTQGAAQWHISTTSGDYTSPVYDSGTDTANLTTITVPAGFLSYGTKYYWQVRHRDSYGNWSDWSTETSFTTADSGAPDTPANTIPVDAATDVPLTPTLEASAFSDPDVGDSHSASQWQIATDTAFTSLVYDSGIDASNLTSISIAPCFLTGDTIYYWRVRYRDSYLTWSDWSSYTSFTTVALQAPNTPFNKKPSAGATDVSLTPKLESSNFSDPDAGDRHSASWWQIATSVGFSDDHMVYETGIDTTHLEELTLPSGVLDSDTTYYWRVRYRDSYWNWSGYSIATSFTTTALQVPDTPSNTSPADDVTGVGVTPTLKASAFSDADPGDSHAFSQWQLSTTPGDYDNPAFDSGMDSGNRETITLPPGYLRYGTRYYWHVRYRDSYGNWSAYSNETSFTTLASGVPDTPANVRPANGTTDIILNPTLESSPFSDPDLGDSHAASWWQVTATSGDYTNLVFNSGLDKSNLTQTVIPSGTLYTNTTYYWHVRYQDSYGNWSDYSAETSFKTIPTKPPVILDVRVSSITSTTAIVTWTTDKPATSQVEYGRTTAYGSTTTLDTNLVTEHSVTLSGLTPSIETDEGPVYTTYYFRARSKDAASNEAVSDQGTFNTDFPPDTTPPVITEIAASSTVNNGVVSTVITWKTDEPATSQVEYGTTTAYGSTTPLNTTLVESHSVTITSLLSNTTYHYRVISKDANDNQSTSADNSFDTPETTPPVISSEQASGITNSGAVITWTTDEPATSQVEYGVTPDYGSFTVLDTTLVTAHTVTLHGLLPNTTYHYRVISKDASDNQARSATDHTFTTAASVAPSTPDNVSPASGATNISLTPTLKSSTFYDSDTGDSHAASMWQVTTDTAFSTIVFDSGIAATSLTSITVPAGHLAISTLYYWRVRYQDSYGNWSGWSTYTGFTTTAMRLPDTPANTSPTNGATGLGLTPSLTGSTFSDPDPSDSHTASQWQITTTAGDYSSPVFDSGTDTANLTSIIVPSGHLSYNTTYYWHVMYRDSYGNWSSYSAETSFTTATTGAPNRPSNFIPADGATDVPLTPTLEASAFSDPDAGDSHAASQWQVASDTAFTGIVYDSGITSSAKTKITIPPAFLKIGTTYYWRVRYRDSYGNWSAYSAATSFTTTAMNAPNTPANSSPAEGATGFGLTPTLTGSAFSDPDVGDSHTASQWQIATNTTFTSLVYDSGIDTTHLTSIAVPSGYLDYNATYYWHVRYRDSYGKWSQYSIETSFTTAVSGAPYTPKNLTPANGATDTSLTPVLSSSAFGDPDQGDIHAASWWQVSTSPGDYSSPVYDSSLTTAYKTQITIPIGKLYSNTTHYWHVKYQDSYGNWSDWSAETSFTTIALQPPSKPINASPLNGATDTAVKATLVGSPFYDPDPYDAHNASQWHITTTPGDYSDPAYDTGTDTVHKATITLPAGILTYNTTYYWQVRYLDSYGKWSAWSDETSFTTVVSGNPHTPSNTSPVNGATDADITPKLRSSAFSDPDGNSHQASQWWVSLDTSFSSLVFDSGIDTSNLTSITIPASKKLSYGTTYYWRVRYQDDTYSWSQWSDHTSFTTIRLQPPDQPNNVSPEDGTPYVTVLPTLAASAFSDPDVGDQHTASQWQIATDAGFTSIVFDSGEDAAHLTSITLAASAQLNKSTTYYWHVRYRDVFGYWSVYSNTTSFTTESAPATPVNESPASGVTIDSLTPTLKASAFQGDPGHTHTASQWQVRTASGTYASPVYDSGIDTVNLTSRSIPSGKLVYGTKYFWHVRYQDDTGTWSTYSTETWFQITTARPPNTPHNVSPQDKATNIALTATLQGDAFSDPDSGDTQKAAQWQIRTTSGTYDNPVFDSGVDNIHLTQIMLDPGILQINSQYYWHVRYQDNRGEWSLYSTETSFTTTVNQPPRTPTNQSPANGATGIGITHTLVASPFSDPDEGDKHAASQWQIATNTTFASTVFDSYTDTVNLTQIAVPSGTLKYGSTYYWHVRYRDNSGNWSAYSSATSFTTMESRPPRRPTPTSPSSGATDLSITPTLKGNEFYDIDVGDAHAATEWQITTTSGDYEDPVWDYLAHLDDPDVSDLTTVTVPAGVLSYGPTYYWRVRYQDSYEKWSDWSQESSFTTTSSKANFSVSPTEPVQENQPVSFTDLSTGGVTSWVWDFGDGTSAQWNEATRPADGKIVHSYSEAGNYTVTLTVDGPKGESEYSVVVQVKSTAPADGEGGLPTWVYIVIGALAVVVVVVLGAALFR